MSELKPFEIKVGGREHILELGKCAVFLFRAQPEVDFLKILDEAEEETSWLEIYNNQELCRWMAGYAIIADEDGDLMRPIITMDDQTFRSSYGWNPLTIESEHPNARMKQAFAELQADKIDAEWENFE